MIRRSPRLVAAALCVTSFLTPQNLYATKQRHGVPDAGCAVPAGWAEVAARRTRYVIFGEIHGTRESPEFIGTLACGLAGRGERLLVGVEHGAAENPALQKAWRLPDSQFAAALRSLGWAGRLDGVASTAMFELLQRLHRLKSQGRSIDIVAFNGFCDEEQRLRFSDLPGQGPHEAAQAENIRKAADAGRYDHVLVLVGNLHARKTRVGDGATRFEPMAMRLARSAAITTVNMHTAGGSMWNCLLKPDVKHEPGKPIPPDAIDCGNHATKALPVDMGKRAFIRLGAFPNDPGSPSYDGYYWLGRVTGSPPAVFGGSR